MPVRGQHVEFRVRGRAGRRVKDWVGPVRERNADVAGTVWVEVAEAVAHGHTVTVTIDASQRGEDIRGGVGDERSVMVGENGPLGLENVQEVRHLLEIGRHVRVIADKMRVIELNIDDMLDSSLGRVQRAGILSLCDTGYGGQKRAGQSECPVQTAEVEKEFHRDPPGMRFRLTRRSSHLYRLSTVRPG